MNQPNTPKPVNVYMFVDALGWEIVRRHHFMESEFPFRGGVKMQFGYSSTAIPTILSGEPPARHGHFSFFYYDPQHTPFKSFRWIKYFFGAGLHPRCILNRGRVRHKLSKWVAKWKGYTGYFQLYNVPFEKLRYFDYCEKYDIFAKNGLAPVRNLRDELEDSGLRFLISDWHKDEAANLADARAAFEKGAVDFAFLYTADFDGFLHDHVGDEAAIGQKLEYYAAEIRTLLDALKKGGRPYTFTVISDHGMTAKTGTVDLMKAVDGLGLKFGADYAAFYDSTLVRLWYLRDGAREKIRARLGQPDCRGHFLTPEEKHGYGIDFPGDKFGQDIFLTEAGVQIEPCDLGRKAMPGMHGFSPEDKDSYASCLSTAQPRFAPAQVRDFFHLMKADILEARPHA